MNVICIYAGIRPCIDSLNRELESPGMKDRQLKIAIGNRYAALPLYAMCKRCVYSAPYSSKLVRSTTRETVD